MARGGVRPTAPQNNPANVNLLGGNGQSGTGSQAPKYIAGMGYGQGQAMMQQQQGAKMAGPTPAFKGSGAGAGALGTVLGTALDAGFGGAFFVWADATVVEPTIAHRDTRTTAPRRVALMMRMPYLAARGRAAARVYVAGARRIIPAIGYCDRPRAWMVKTLSTRSLRMPYITS